MHNYDLQSNTEPLSSIPPGKPSSDAENFVRPTPRVVMGSLIYLFCHIFIVPILIVLIAEAFGFAVPEAWLNFITFAIAAICLTVFMRKYLRESLIPLRRHGAKTLRDLIIGYIAIILLNIVVAIVIGILVYALGIPSPQNENQEAVVAMLNTDMWLMIAIAVVLAPIVEELIFRGVIFAPLRERSRFLAYVISALAFALMHVLVTLLFSFTPVAFLVMLVYVPSGRCARGFMSEAVAFGLLFSCICSAILSLFC